MVARRSTHTRVLGVVLVVALAMGIVPPTPPVSGLAGDVGAPATQAPPPGPALYDEAVLADDPLVHYRLDDATGPAVDASGNGRAGTYGSSAVREVAGALLDDPSTAVRTTVTNQHAVTASDAGLPTGSAARSVEVWVRSAANGEPFIGYGTFHIKLDGSDLRVVTDSVTGVNFRLPEAAVAQDWHHYVATVSATGEVVAYIDGQRLGTQVDPAVTTALTGSMVVGEGVGDYDEAAVYDTVLAPAQVLEHFHRGASRTASDTCDPEVLTPTDPYGMAVVADEPVTYLRMGEAPQTGDDERVVYDHSGACRHGASRPDVERDDPGVEGAEASLSRTTGSVATYSVVQGADHVTAGSSPMTVEMWSNTAQTGRYLFTIGQRYGIYIDSTTTGRMVHNNETGAGTGVPGTFVEPLVAGIWHHWAVTFGDDRITVYMDGVEIGTETSFTAPGRIVVPDPGAPIRIGEGSGAIDEFALYDTALSATEVAQRAALGHDGAGACPTATGAYGAEVLADEPLAFYRMGERAADADARAMLDHSGGCRHGGYASDAVGVGSGALALGDGGAVAPASSAVDRWAASATASAFPVGAAPVTIETWVRGAPAWNGRWIARYGDRLGIYVNDASSLRVYHAATSAYLTVPLPYPFATDGWHHVVATSDGTVISAYVDGVLLATKITVPSTTAGGRLAIGEAGPVDEVAVYPSALTGDRIRAHWSVGRSDDGSACRPGSTSGHAQGVLDDGPIGYWRLGDVDESDVGQVVFDLADGCRNGAYDRPSTSTAGALAGDGDGGMAVTAPTAEHWGMATSAVGLPSGTAPVSVEVWSTGAASARWIFRYGDRVGLYVAGSSTARLYWGPGSGNYVSVPLATALDGSTWHHFAMTYDGTVARVYVDGVQRATATVTLSTTTPDGELRVGAAPGSYDELAVFDRALSAGEVADRVANAARIDTSTTLALPPGDVIVGEDLDVEVEVMAGDGGATTPTGTVVVRDGSTVLDSAPLEPDGTATITVQVDEGPFDLIAEYQGSATHAASRSQGTTGDAVVVHETATALSIDPNPAAYGQPATATILVTGEGPGTPTGTVDLLVEGVPVGEDELDPVGAASIALPTRLPGSATVTARYLGDTDHLGSTSAAVEHEVLAGATTVDLEVAPSRPWSAPVAVEVAVAAVAPAVGTPGGVVEVEVDGIVAGDGTLSGGSATIVLDGPIDPGEHVVVARYTGASAFTGATSDPADLEVVPATAEVEVSADPSPSVVGTDVEVTVDLAPVAPATAEPTGDVTLFVDDVAVDTAEDVEGQATFTLEGLDLGLHDLRAELAGSARWQEAEGEVEHRVGVGSTTELEVGPAVVFGQEVSATVHVTGDGVGPTPTGTVQILDGDDVVAEGTLDGAGWAELSVDGLPVGEHDLVAAYLGDDRHVPGRSGSDTATVTKAASHVTLTATPDPSGPDQDVVLSARVRPVAPGAGTPTGFVTFYEEGETAPLGTAVLGLTGAAAITVSFPTEGSRRLVAVYGGDGSFTAGTSAAAVHHVSPATDLGLAADPTEIAHGETVELTATVTAAVGTPVGAVTFVLGDDELATVPVDGAGVAVHEATDLGHGTHTIEARFAGTAFAPSTDEVTVTVVPAESEVALSLDPDPSTYGETVAVAVEVTAPGVDPGATTGFAVLRVDGDPVATLTVVDGEAVYELEGLDVGDHEVEVAYGGRPDGDLTSASDETTHTVGRAATEVAVEAPGQPVGPGDEVPLVATVTRATPGGEGIPTGEVTFVADGTTTLGTAAVVDGVATLVTDDLDVVRTWSITADYDGDGRHLPATSVAVDWVVLEGVTITVTPPVGPTALGDPASFAVTVAPHVPGPVPTGEVVLLRDGVELARATLDGAGTATLATDHLRAGGTEVEVAYEGDPTYAPATSAPVTHEVDRSPVVVTVAGSPDPAVAGATVMVTARVVGAAHHVVRPSGTVRIWLPSGEHRDVTLDRNGVGSVRIEDGLAIGVHEVSARYDGDDDHEGAPTVEGEVEVVAPVDVGISLDPSTATVGTTVTATATGSPGTATLAWDFGDGSAGTGSTTTHTYTEPGLYTVTLRATEDGATTYVSARLEVGPDLPLAAEAGEDQIVADGVAALFDGRRSVPLPGIDSWLWELGDGTTSAEPTLSHTYSVPGTYVVRLTVTDDGATATDEALVVVEPVDSETGLHVTVDGIDGPLEGADVLVVDGLGQDHRAATGADGTAVLAGLGDHQYSVYAIADGYRPRLVKATVIDGYGTASLTLEAGERGITEVASRRLTDEEALAAGVDLDDPDNSHVYEFEVWLDFSEVELPGGGGILVNRGGRIISPWCTPDRCHFNTDHLSVTVSGSPGSGPGGAGEGGPSLVWLVMPGRAQWMKEVFEVQMVVQNLTDPDFALEDGAATISLPGGLSLAGLEDPQTTTVEMDDIVGGSSAAARWIVRGDTAGSYDIEVGYTGSLYPLGTSVRIGGVSAEPLQVWGADALALDVTVEEHAEAHAPYEAEVAIRNTADVPVYNVALDLFEQGTGGFIYQPRQRLSHFDDELAPGESLVAEAILVPRGEGDHDTTGSFVESVGGTATMPATITSVPEGPPAPTMCTAGGEVEEDGECNPGDNPFGEIDLTWEPIGGPYRVYRSPSDSIPFPRTPLVETSDTSYRYRSVPGEAGFFAVTQVQGDTEVMIHNAVASETGNRPSAKLDLFVECLPGSGMQLRIDYHDAWYPLEQYRIVTGLDENTGEPAPGQYLGGGPLAGMEGTTEWPLSPGVFADGPHLQEVPLEDGGSVEAALIIVQVRNVHDGIWGVPAPVLVFPDCDEPFSGIPSEQTYGSSCKSEEYWARFDVEGANPSKCMADPVNSATGSLVATAGDLALPANGIAFEMARAYNSADATTGILGRGWTHAFNLGLTFPDEGVITYRAGDGQQVTFFQDLEEEDPGDWFRARSSHAEIERRPVGTECGGCTYVLRRPDQTFAHFDEEGRLLQLVDRNGNGLTFTNDLAGRPTSVVDPAGRIITFGYEPGGLLASVTLPDGRDVAYGYTDGLLTTVTDVRDGTTTYRYEDELLVEETDPRGQRVHLTAYDPVTGRAVRQEDGEGAVTTWTWDAGTETSTMTDSEGGVWVDRYRDNVLQSSTDPLGRTTSFTYDARHNVIQVVDPSGAVVTQTWDDAGNLLRATGPLGRTDTYTYDDLGNRTSWTRPDGEVITYSYDSLGRPEAVDGPGTVSATSHHDPEGLLVWTEDGEGRRTVRDHDADGNETSLCTPLEHCTTKTYDASGRLLTVVGPNGNAPGGDPEDHTVTFGYDAADNRTSETDPLGRTTSYTYDAAGNLTVVEEPDGRTVTRTYDAADQVVTESVEGATPTTYEYDGRGNLVRQVSPEGRTTLWSYDAAGQLTGLTDGEGRTWTYSYDVLGRPTSVRDPEGGVARVVYDAAGRPIRQIDPAGAVTEVTYDVMGNPLRVKDPTGATTRRTYTAAGLVATETDAAGGVTTHEYDSSAKPIRSTTPTGEVTETAYDDDGRPTAITGPLGFVPGATPEDHTTHMVYDPAGNLTETIDPLDRVTASTHDPLGRVLTVTDPGGRTTAYGYDEMGRQTSITTPDLAVTEWEYSAAGDLVRRGQPDGGDTTYTYDDDHLRLTETDALGRTWRTAYDGNGRPTQMWDAIATASGPSAPATTTSIYDGRGLLLQRDHSDPLTADVTFTYDAAGRQVSMRDGAAVQTHRYDAAGRLLEVRRGAEVFTYTHDAAGRPATTTYPDGTEIGTAFDRSGRLRSVRAFGDTTSYSYDGAGRLATIAFPNGVTEDHQYDALGRSTGMTATRGATEVTAQARTYRPDGTVASDVTPAGEASYLHDERDRLEDACYGTCAPSAPTIRYGYDEAGNRIAEEADGETLLTADHDAADQIDDVLPIDSGAYPVVHDGNGNVVDDGLRTYRYDGAGQLVEVAVADPAGRSGSISGTVTDPTGGPLEGVVVRAYGFGREVAAVVTDADGTYELTGLPATAYDVYFDDLEDGTHLSAWHGGATMPAGSVPIEVAPEVGSTADAVLSPVDVATHISGQVTDDEGDPISGALVTVRSASAGWLEQHLAPFAHPIPSEMGIGSVALRAEVEGQRTYGSPIPVEAGDDIEVAIQVTNAGARPLADVEVAFPGVDLACPVDDGDDVVDQLAVGQVVRCTGVVTALVGGHTVEATATTAAGDVAEEVTGYFGMGACTITGTAGDDILVGTPGPDVICGLAGDDQIDGRGGDDVIRGGPGADEMAGGTGADVIEDGGGDDDDVLYGEGHVDLLYATGGDDILITDNGADVAYGGEGDDTLMAGPDGSVLVGGAGANTVVGGTGPDRMFSSGSGGSLNGGGGQDRIIVEGADTVLGGGGVDVLVMSGEVGASFQGGPGDDVLLGGPGDDVLQGGTGVDLTIGGPGSDTFPGIAPGSDMVIQDDVEASTITDEEGRWSLRVPAGVYVGAVGAGGYLGELWGDTRWFPDIVPQVDAPVTAGAHDTELAPDPDWVEIPTPEPPLGEPGEVLARYTYDGTGNRVTATTAEGTTRYTWDISGAPARLATTVGPDGGSTIAWGVGPVSVADAGADPRYLHLDATGSVTAVTDGAGAVVGRAAYEPFGAMRWSEGEILDGTIGGIPFGFAGEQLDAETRLYYLRARYYDPAWGRFTQPDPAGWITDAGHESTYLYAAGSPLDTIDPTGLRVDAAMRDRAWIEQHMARQEPQGLIDRIFSMDIDIHTVLDGAGMVPGIGEIADGINAVIYLAEGDVQNAAISVAGMAIGFGSAATGARLMARYGSEAAAGTKAVFRQGDEIAEVAANFSSVRRRLDVPTDRLTRTIDVPTSSGVSGACRVNSFVPGTRVLMADGSTRAIEDIDLGDEVWAADPVTGEEGPRPVTDLITGHGDKTLVEIEIDGETVIATDGHPIWVDSEGRWVDAEDVEPGDLLLDEDGVTLVVDAVEIVDVTDQTVHNLTVADIHTFFVQAGDTPLLTHNCSNPPDLPKGAKGTRPNPLTNIPADARIRPLKPEGYGIEMRWEVDGEPVRFRVHGPDPTAPPGSNAANGDVYRIRIGQTYRSPDGTIYAPNVHKPSSKYYNPLAANETHIPWPGIRFPM